MLKRGYLGLRIAEVARMAGISRGALLHHFPTKDALAASAIERGYEKLAERTLSRVALLSSAEDPLRVMIADTKEFFFSEFFFLLVDMCRSEAKEVSTPSRQASRKFRVPIEDAWIKALRAGGMPESVASDAVWLTMSIVRGLAVRTLVQDEPVRFQHLFDVWRKIFWTYIDSMMLDVEDRPPAPRRAKRRAAAT